MTTHIGTRLYLLISGNRPFTGFSTDNASVFTKCTCLWVKWGGSEHEVEAHLATLRTAQQHT
ncbi:hypothetical protein KSF_111900 [Reticulibacter mediterranei]|uniref:Uncharacterized protein n=1 Tax=Reticulibacter mediterranei TaxID=2778369 RepID=A0A8J3J2I1_9CHLR|nr:hypothetical protein KSF_111900 [Reticulibacter mediterranei]